MPAVMRHAIGHFCLALCLCIDGGVGRTNAGEPPPADAIILFNGTDLAHWVRANGGAPGWSITNGVLTVVPGSGSIRTFETFQDFEMHLEFRFLTNSPAGTAEGNLINSGVYLQDQFEIQIMESFNRTLSGANDGGSIWSIRDANSNASLPGGEWESYDIGFQAARWTGGVKTANARVSLRWNGVLVHDNVEIPRPTDGGATPENQPPAGIRLQDLVGPVQFRNIWVRPLESMRPPSPDALTLVPAGSSWRHLDDGSDQGTAWRAPGFDDTDWNFGTAELGYGDGDEKTLIRSNRVNGTRIETTYFRKSFVATNVWAITNLSVALLRDDGGVVYLNGAEIFRSNMTNATVAFTNWAASAVNVADESRFFATNASPALVVEGTNILAVEIHQSSSTSSDLSFDLRLTALAYRNPGIHAWRSGAELRLMWPIIPGGFLLESSPKAGPEAQWSSFTGTPILSTNGFHATTTGFGDAGAFYRLKR